MKEKKKISIHRTLLRAHLSTMLAAVAAVGAIFCIWQLEILSKNIESDLQQTCRTVALNVDKELQRMDSISINVLYSNLIRDNFSAYMGETPEATLPHGGAAKKNSAAVLTDLLTAIMGADRSVRQINLYNNLGGAFGTGMYYGAFPQNAIDQPWYQETLASGGHKYIAPPAENSLLSRRGASKGQLYISLCRQYFNPFNQPEGFVEILQYYDVIYETALHPESVYQPRIFLYDPQGRVMFPADTEGIYSDYFTAKPTDISGVIRLKNPQNPRREYAVYGELPHSGFTVAVVLDGSQYYAPIFQFACSMMALFAAVVLVGWISVYSVTRRLSAPLGLLYDHLSGLNFNKRAWSPMAMEDSNILEIDVLRDSINRFQTRLEESLDNVMLLERQELQSQMLALQSQMNPHFLYNSLATVSAMAEEGMTEEIGEICSNITAILRYISSNKQQLVPLEDELENTYRYLNCLKLRFGDSLSFDIHIPDEMLDLLVPKLCVQLLVENAMKFTTPNPPPWRIEIQGVLDAPRWSVTVLDNGKGFSEETLEILRGKMDQIDKSKLLPSLELNGMGLMNIYIRLHLLYGTGHFFELGNRQSGGAAVTIGGTIYASDQALSRNGSGG